MGITHMEFSKRQKGLYSKKYTVSMSSVNVATQVLSTTNVRGWSVQPQLFSTNDARILVSRNDAATRADFDFVVTNESLLYVEDTEAVDLRIKIIDASGTDDVSGGALDYVIITEYK